MRLEGNAHDIPPDLGVTSITNTLDYARTRLRSKDLLLPQSVDVTVTYLKGVENLNRIEFSQCREFRGTAELSFDEPAAAGEPTSPTTELQLPANLELSVHLAQAVDSKTAAVGDQIAAIVDTPAHYRRSVLIPKGARLQGRIRRMERQVTPRPYYLVGLEFTDIEFPGHFARFFGEMLGAQAVPGLSPGIGTYQENSYAVNPIGTRNTLESGRITTTHFEDEVPFQIPGVSTFFMEGPAIRLPEGLRMTWRTIRLSK